MESSPKPRLPEGWIVKCSKTYKGKLYYFNENTGDSAWHLDQIVDFAIPARRTSSVSSVSSEGMQSERSATATKDQHKRKWKSDDGEDTTTVISAKKRLKRPTFCSPSVATYSPPSTDSGHSTLGSDTSLAKTRCTILPATSAIVKLEKTDSQAGVMPVDDSEAMEVDEVDDEEMIMDIQEVREKLQENPHTICGELTKLSSTHSSYHPSPVVSNVINIVLDTNALLSDLKLIQTLPQEFQDLPCELKFLVPWVVLQELDAFKDERYCKNMKPHISRRAQLAIKYVHSQLSSSKSHFQGQMLSEVFTESNANALSNDDRILQYCLSFAKRSSVILFTNDVNLRNKAIVNNITAKGREDIADGISLLVSKMPVDVPLAPSASRRLQITQQTVRELNVGETGKSELGSYLREAFSPILEIEMRKVFQELWHHVVLRKPPWTLDNLLQCYDKHWLAVFGFFMPKSAREDFVKLKKFFFNKSGQRVTVKTLVAIIDVSIRFLGALQRHSDYNGIVSKALDLVTKLYVKCASSLDEHKSDEPVITSWDGRNCGPGRPASSSTVIQSPGHPPPHSEIASPNTVHIAHTPPLNHPSGRVSKALPASELPPLELCLPVPDACANVLTEKLAFEVKRMFDVVWSNIVRFVGILCERFGCHHSFEFEKPEVIPSMDVCLNFLPRLYPVVCRLTKELRGVLEVASNDKSFIQNCGFLHDSLMNFNESLDMQEERCFEEVGIKAFCAYCEIEERRKEMRDSLWKMVEIRSIMTELVQVTKPQGLAIE